MKMLQKNNSNKSAKQLQTGRAERIFISHIFFDNEKIYEEYVDKTMLYQQFKRSVVSNLIFIQKFCKAGLEENDIQRLNGVINFCESFLIKNNLKYIEQQKTETVE
jgi:hypothetical protein